MPTDYLLSIKSALDKLVHEIKLFYDSQDQFEYYGIDQDFSKRACFLSGTYDEDIIYNCIIMLQQMNVTMNDIIYNDPELPETYLGIHTCKILPFKKLDES